MAARSGPRFPQVASILFVILLTGLLLIIPATAPSAFSPEPPSGETNSEEGAFAGSQLIVATDKVREGETIAYTLTVLYSGNEAQKEITVGFRVPDPAMFVSSSPPLVFNEEERMLTWQGEIKSAEKLAFTITLVTRPDSAGSRSLLADAGINWQGGSHWLQSETEIHSRLTPILYVLPNGIDIGKAELVLLAYLVLGPLLILVIPLIILGREKRRRDSRQKPEEADKKIEKILLFAMSFAFVCTLGIVHLMCSVALEDIRRFVAYQHTSCTLLDKRIVLNKGSSSSGVGSSRREGLSTTTVYNEPLVAVRYLAGNREIIAAGPPRPTAMLSPVDRYALRELARYERGHSYPCWYDPQRPEIFVLARGISLGWYLLGIGPMILLYFLGRSFLHRMTK